MKKNILFSIAIGFMLSIFAISSVMAAEVTINISDPSKASNTKDAQFIVQTLKYDPYPVNPGDWFDVWLSVINVGEDDASGVKFEILPEYPFSASEELIRTYRSISGKVSTYQNVKQGGERMQDNQVLLKYRIKAADNAPEGTSALKFSSTYNITGHSQIYTLPIVIKDTRTRFDVALEETNLARTIFTISNSGDESATAVSATLRNDNGLIIHGPSSIIIGNLNPGEFVPVSFNIIPSKDIHSVTLQISYTDISGIRNYLDKEVALTPAILEVKSNTLPSDGIQHMNWIYGISGLLTGLIIALLFTRIGKKKKE